MSPSYRQSTKSGKERQGTTLGVRFIEVSVKRELTVLFRVNSIHPDSFSAEYELPQLAKIYNRLISWRYTYIFFMQVVNYNYETNFLHWRRGGSCSTIALTET